MAPRKKPAWRSSRLNQHTGDGGVPAAADAVAAAQYSDHKLRAKAAAAARAARRWIENHSELVLISLVIGICLLIGFLTVGDYGASWDETPIYSYADYSLEAYRFLLHPRDLPPFQNNLNLYGPAYFMGVALLSRIIQAIEPSWSMPTTWHFCYFVTFLAGAVLLYLLLRRSLGAPASLGACLLFLAQPLLWGHAFINPKDMPFMVFFLASVYLGLQMVDHYASPRPNYAPVVGAAVVLGVAVSVRSAAPWAGALVGVYAFYKSPRRALTLLPVYILVACLTTYLTWPFLWGAPIHNFVQSLETMSQFPFPSKVLFNGHFYASDELPRRYYPILLGLQLTPPMLSLAVTGLGVAVWNFIRRPWPPREPLALFLAWFLLPALPIVALRSALYDNGRQLFFLLPPLFLLVGLSLEALLRLLRFRWLWAGLVLLCVIPGLYGGIRLHPYEYVYYNQFAGGTGGAYRKYEMDYWATSYREVALWLDQHAGEDSTIWATGPVDLLRLYLRPDLIISCTEDAGCGKHYDYVVILARWKAEQTCAGAERSLTIGREEAVFAIVRHLLPGQLCN